MSDWPVDIIDLSTFGILSPAAEGSPVGDGVAAANLSFNGTAVWPAANKAFYVPILLREQVIVYQLGWLNGATVSGNVDAAILDAEGNRLISAGSTAMAGVSLIQLVDVADTVIPAGLNYIGMAVDNITATFQRTTTGAQLNRACGVAEQATAFPIPSAATFAAMTGAFIPLVFAAIAGAVI